MPPASSATAVDGATAAAAIGVGLGWQVAAGGATWARADAAAKRQRPDNNTALGRSVRRSVLIVFAFEERITERLNHRDTETQLF